jgi:hypothetical protein
MGKLAGVRVQRVPVWPFDNLGLEFVQVGVDLIDILASVQAAANGRKCSVELLGVMV